MGGAGVEDSRLAVPRSVWRGVFLVLAAAWAWLVLVVGMLLIADWSDWTGPSVWPGVALIALGEFIGAVVADRLFPRASRRLSATVEITAWTAVLVAVGAWFAG